MRRFTRLTNGFSKKTENLIHAVSLHFVNGAFVSFRHCAARTTHSLSSRLDNSFDRRPDELVKSP